VDIVVAIGPVPYDEGRERTDTALRHKNARQLNSVYGRRYGDVRGVPGNG
jgi:hypothetical protein